MIETSMYAQVDCPLCRCSEYKSIGYPLLPLYQRFPACELSLAKSSRARRRLLECKKCGLRYFDRIPTYETLASLYDGKALASCWNVPTRVSEQLRKLSLGADSLFSRSDVSVLDIGCHTGHFLASLPSSWDKSGVELNPGSLEVAKNMLTDADWILGSFEEAEVRSRFDLITAWDVLEHVRDVDTFLSKVSLLLKRGGYFVFETGNYTSGLARSAGLAWYYYSLFEHTVFYNEAMLKRELSDYGLEVVKIFRTVHNGSVGHLRPLLLTFLIVSLTGQGRFKVFHHLLARVLGRAGTLPQPTIQDHILVFACAQ